jgi:protein-disulfide isomerase
LCLAFAETPKSQLSSDDTAVLAEVDGIRITAAEFNRRKPQALFQAQQTLYDAKKKALEALVDDVLLEREARKENVTVEELLKRHIEPAIGKEPSDEVLKVYYEGVDSTEPFETAKDKIREYIRQRRIVKAKTAYVESLRKQAQIAYRLDPPRAGISLAGTPIRGGKNAPVTLVEFADFECPYCQMIHPDLTKLQAELGDKVAFAFKDLPLPSHTHAQKAAEAAHCAGAQGKYWEFHDRLFEKKQYEVANLKATARELKLNGDAFDKCLDSGAQAEFVRTSLNEAQALTIPGTPAFFVNGRFISGPASYEGLKNAIEEELARAASAPTTGMLRK